MKKYISLLFQTSAVLIGISAFAFLLFEPHIEGRNVNATLFEIYSRDPFLAYAYIASIPFFVILYKAFKVSEYMTQPTIDIPKSIQALKTIIYCAIATIGFVMIGESIIVLSNDSDDIAGGVFMGFLVILFSVATITTTMIAKRSLRKKGSH
ncbi:MAG: hypothetical protein RLZZ308_190 [Candidatus Parcubacteria bacterium]|jgi:hypothetical protein